MKKVQDEQEVDYSAYGYPDGAKMEISAELFTNICEVINVLGQKESMIAFEQKESLEEMLSPENRAKPIITPLGIQLLQVSLSLNRLHEENVDKGIAVSAEELQKPKISLSPE